MGILKMARFLVFIVTARGSNGGGTVWTAMGNVHTDQFILCFVQFYVIYKGISYTAALGKCLNFHTSFALFISHVYRGSNEKHLVCKWCSVGGHTRYSQLCTVPPCLSRGEECINCPTVLGETVDRGGRTFPLLSKEGETTLAKQLIIMDLVCFASYLYVLLFLHLQFTLMALDLPGVWNIKIMVP
jgi:hypothetical protein